MLDLGLYRSSGWCYACERQSVMEKRRINHLLHLWLSVLTLGVWLLVWAALGFRNAERPPHCARCGTEADRGPMPPVLEPWEYSP